MARSALRSKRGQQSSDLRIGLGDLAGIAFGHRAARARIAVGCVRLEEVDPQEHPIREMLVDPRERAIDHRHARAARSRCVPAHRAASHRRRPRSRDSRRTACRAGTRPRTPPSRSPLPQASSPASAPCRPCASRCGGRRVPPGSSPVMIEACEGSVIGAVAYARSKRTPRRAIASMAGVRAEASPYAPTRSARSVSMVTSTRCRAWLRRRRGPIAGAGRERRSRDRGQTQAACRDFAASRLRDVQSRFTVSGALRNATSGTIALNVVSSVG